MSQPFLIDKIIRAIKFETTTTKSARDNVPFGFPLLNKDEYVPARKSHRKYRGLIGMLGYLQGTSHPGMSMATHQCAQSNNDPNLHHGREFKKIIRYLLDTQDKKYTPSQIYPKDWSAMYTLFLRVDGNMATMTHLKQFCLGPAM